MTFELSILDLSTCFLDINKKNLLLSIDMFSLHIDLSYGPVNCTLVKCALFCKKTGYICRSRIL